MFLWDLRNLGQFMSPCSVLDCPILEDSDNVLCNLYEQIFIQMWLILIKHFHDLKLDDLKEEYLLRIQIDFLKIVDVKATCC